MSVFYRRPTLPECVRIEFPIVQKNQSLDFCNSFWGFGDAGVDTLFARMRGAAQTTEDLNAFWKERASIEEDYAERLAKLAKMGLGRDETGDLRKSLDTMVDETKSQARFHLSLAQQFRSGLEIPTTAFHVRLLHHKTIHQAGIEKLFKTKQFWESCVNEVREKCEQEYARIKSFKAQASLALGKDRKKINVKLERIQESIQTHERKLSNFSMALKETIIKWEQNWKSFCDDCQDMEEDRMNFMKNILLNYANAVSEVYHMADSAYYESMKVSFDRMAGENDLATFVLESGSGNQIPDPFDFVNYSPGATPSFEARLTSRIAEFTRSTSRELPSIQNSMPLARKEGPVVSAASIGDGKRTTNANLLPAYSAVLPEERTESDETPRSSNVPPSDSKPVAPPQQHMSNEAGSSSTPTRRFFFRHPSSNASTTSVSSIATTLPDYSDVLPEGQTELGEAQRLSNVPLSDPGPVAPSQQHMSNEAGPSATPTQRFFFRRPSSNASTTNITSIATAPPDYYVFLPEEQTELGEAPRSSNIPPSDPGPVAAPQEHMSNEAGSSATPTRRRFFFRRSPSNASTTSTTSIATTPPDYSDVLPEGQTASGEAPSSSNVPLSDPGPVAPPQEHMSNEAGPSATPTRRRFFFRRSPSNASTTSTASIATTPLDYSDVLPEGQTESGEAPRSSNVPPSDPGPVAPPQEHMSNEAGSSATPTQRFFFRRPSPNASTTSVASIATTFPDCSDVLPEGKTESGEAPSSSNVPEQLQNTISTSQKAIRPLPIPPTVPVSMVPESTQPAGVEVAEALADWQPVFEEHMSPSQRNRTAGSHALSDEKSVAGYEDPGMDTLRGSFSAFDSTIRARTARRTSQSSNTSHLWMWPPAAAAPYDNTVSWMSSGLPPPSDSLAGLKRHQLYDAPIPRDDTSSLRAPSVRSQLVNKRPMLKLDDQEIVHSYSRPGQPQLPVTHEHRQAIHGSILTPNGYPLNQISTGGGAQFPAETPQHRDPSNLVWKSPCKPLLQAVDDVLDSDEADESGSYYSAIDETGSYYSVVDEPEVHMPVVLPQTSGDSGQFNSFLKQHEHNSLNSNVNPINFVIKKMLKARRIVHRMSVQTYSTSKSSISKLGTNSSNSFVSYSSESAENFSSVSLSTSWR